jgi:hypothetical protein
MLAATSDKFMHLTAELDRAAHWSLLHLSSCAFAYMLGIVYLAQGFSPGSTLLQTLHALKKALRITMLDFIGIVFIINPCTQESSSYCLVTFWSTAGAMSSTLRPLTQRSFQKNTDLPSPRLNLRQALK